MCVWRSSGPNATALSLLAAGMMLSGCASSPSLSPSLIPSLIPSLMEIAAHSTNAEACPVPRSPRAGDLTPSPPAGALAFANAPAALQDTERARLELAFAQAVSATGAPTMTAAVARPGAVWSQRHGEARLHYWASVGKVATALTVMRLVENGALSLDTPLERHVPGVPGGDAITVDMLLTHTAGLAGPGDGAGAGSGSGARPGVAAAGRAVACPGTQFRYSNLGYSLLGAVIESASGEPYAQAVQRLVIEPSGATGLRILTPGRSEADIAVPQPTGRARTAPLSTIGAAGAIAGDARSVAIFWRAVLEGRVVRRASVQRMFATLYPMGGEPMAYGRGVIVYTVPLDDGSAQTWVGHSGGIPGARAMVAFVPSHNAVIAVALTGEGSAEASANALRQALEGPGGLAQP